MSRPHPDPKRVLIRFVMAKEWPSQQSLQWYLKSHPKADKTKHWVKGDKPTGQAEPKPKEKAPADESFPTFDDWVKPQTETKAPAKAKGKEKAKAKPQPKEVDDNPDGHPRKPQRNPQGRGWIEIPRTTFKKEDVAEALATFDVSVKSKWSKLVKASGADDFEARDWTMKWQGSSELEEIEKFVADVHTKGSWANQKYSATQALIEANMERLVADRVIDRDGYITLYRGVGPPQSEQLDNPDEPDADGCDLNVRGLSSWSENFGIADGFATRDGEEGKVLKTKIHYTRVVNYWGIENDDWRTEKEWTIMSDSAEDASIECSYVKQDRYASEKDEAPKKKKITLDDDNENWLRKVTLDRLRKKGWKGTLKEWYEKKSK